MGYQITDWRPGDSANIMLGKLLQKFGGTPLPGDSGSGLLRKMLVMTSAAEAATAYLTAADLAPYALTADLAPYALTADLAPYALTADLAPYALTADLPLNFRDSPDDQTALLYTEGGTTEQLRVEAVTGDLIFVCTPGDAKRLELSNDTSAVVMQAGVTANAPSLISLYGPDFAGAGAGSVNIVTINRNDLTDGFFRVRNASNGSLVPDTRFQIAWNGDTLLSPVWNDGTVSFTGFEIDITTTAFATGSLALDIQRSASSVFAVNNYGNVVQAQSVLTYNASTAIDFNLGGQRTISLSGNVTFTTTNVAAGKEVTIKILADGTPRDFIFPAWIFVGTEPTSIAAGKTAILSLRCYGAADANIVAAYAVEA